MPQTSVGREGDKVTSANRFLSRLLFPVWESKESSAGLSSFEHIDPFVVTAVPMERAAFGVGREADQVHTELGQTASVPQWE